MNKLLSILFLLSFVIGCETMSQTAHDDKKGDKIIVTNLINETKIVGEAAFIDPIKNISIKVKPVDTRKFEREIRLGNYLDGQHKSILTMISEVNINEAQSSQDKHELLTNKLLDEGFSFYTVRSVIEAIDKKKEAPDFVYVYSDPNIRLTNEYEVNSENPFAIDDRYLTVVEFLIENRSNESQQICNDEFVLTGKTTNYSNIPTNELLNDFHSGSIQYELLHKLLMKKCEVVPANTKIITHLVFPSFYNEESLTINYQSGRISLKETFQIETSMNQNHYVFSKIRVIGFGLKGFPVLRDIEPGSYSVDNSFYSNEAGRSGIYQAFHFIKIGNTVKNVGFNDFLIHDKTDLNTVEVLTIRYKNNDDVEIIKTPITLQDISTGIIDITTK